MLQIRQNLKIQIKAILNINLVFYYFPLVQSSITTELSPLAL